MKRLSVVSLMIVLLLSFSLSCGDKDDLIMPPASLNSGTANFSTYVSVGNSLTAGYQSGALYRGDSQYSYPNLIAQQIEATFVQPLIEYPGIGSFDPETGTIYGVFELASLAGSPTPATATGNPLNLFSNATATVFHNLGIPGIMTYDALNAVSSTTTFGATYLGSAPNTFVDIVLRGGGSQMAQAIAQSPTFMTVWIGNNDVLGAVVTGNVVPGVMPTPSTNFQVLFEAVVAAVAGPGIDFVVANIPSVTSIPFVTTIPPYVFDPVTKVVYLDNNGAPVPWAGITDPTTSYVLLSASSALAASTPVALGGPGVPLADAYFLDAEELTAINAAVTAYNNIIDQLASTYGYSVVDMNSVLEDAQDGISLYGEVMSTSFITGGLMSLDGIHPSSRGYGLAANEFIKVINSTYNSEIPLIEVNDLPAITFPTAKSGRPMSYYDFFRETDIMERLKALYPAPSQ